MSSDPPTDPKIPKTSEDLTEERNEHIGTHGELILPDVVPIIRDGSASPFGIWLNRWWFRTNYLLRGIAGTGVEWFAFFVGAAAQYPKVSVVLLAITVMFTEEKFSEQPVMTNIMKYAMQSYDPDAADRIFAEKPVERDPIGKAARKAMETATKDYMESSEYLELQDEISQDVQRQTRRQTYAAAGMTEDVKAVDQEILEAAQERASKRASKRAAEKADEAPAEEAPEEIPRTETSHIERATPEPEPEPEPEAAPEPEPAPEVVPEPEPTEGGAQRTPAERTLREGRKALEAGSALAGKLLPPAKKESK